MTVDELRRQLESVGNCRTYCILRLGDERALCLIVPRGAENLDTWNVMDGKLPPPNGSTDPWERVTTPGLAWIEATKPKLTVIRNGTDAR